MQRQTWSFYFSYALKSLKRGGQRVVIALLCIAFGVMSLVAMQNLASSIEQIILIDPRYRVGGDILVSRAENFLSSNQVVIFEKLRTEGKIESFTPVARSNSLMLRLPNSGKVTFVSQGLGIDPASYPLYGKFELNPPVPLATAIAEPGSAALTQEIAKQLGLKPGDSFVLSSQANAVPTTLRVSGIIAQTPDSMGGKIFYSLTTARQFRGSPDALTDVLVRWGQANDPAKADLTAAGWQINYATDRSATDKKIAEVFDFMLKGAGILGLLVGGIGVANTMLVLLAGRREEIAILKTLGIRKKRLLLLLGLETVLLGAGGGVIGVLIALGLSNALLYLFSQTGAMLLKWSFDPWLLLFGLLAGTFTALVFGMFAIVRAGEVRPMLLLRNLPVEIRHSQTALLALALAVPFVGFTSFILSSLWNGLLILLIAIVGLLLIGGGLGLLLWLSLKGLPTFRFYLLKMARRNLSRRWLTNLFAMVALFTGIFSLTFAAAVIESSQKQLDRFSLSQNGYNLVVTAPAAQETAISNTLAEQKLTNQAVRYEVLPAAITLADGRGVPEFAGLTLQGRATLWDVKLESDPNWPTNPAAVYLPEELNYPKGIKLLITGANGVQETVTVAGTYQATNFKSLLVADTTGLLLSKDLVLKLGGSQTRLTFALQVPVDHLTQTSDKLGKALPQTLLVTANELSNYFTQQLRGLFWFAVAMAGLALLAGAVLVANTVGLAMVERKREMGILKAVGYTRRQVLQTVLLEYGLLAVIAGAGAVIAAQIVILGLTIQLGGVLTLNFSTALAGIATGLVVTLATAAVAAWRPLQVRPVVILNR